MGKKFRDNHTLKMLIGAVMISFSAVFIKLVNVGPNTGSGYRMLFGGIFLLVLSVNRREKLFSGFKPLVLAGLAAIFFLLDLSLWFSCVKYVGPGLGTLLPNMQAILMAAIGVLFFKEKVSPKLILGIIGALAGLLLLCGLKWNQFDSQYKKGILLGLAAGVCYTGFLLTLKLTKSRDNTISPIANMSVVSLLTMLFLFTAAIISGESLIPSTFKDLLLLLGYGLICQGAGWVFISQALPHLPASKSGVILLLQPTLSMTYDVLFFGRLTTPVELLGIVLVIFSIYTISTRGSKKVPRPEES